MHSSENLLFVYGTLRPLSDSRAASNTRKHLGTAKAQGTVYNLGWFPGAKFCEKPSDQPIIGDVLVLRDKADLRSLDGYEGYVNHEEPLSDANLYHRKKITVVLDETGEEVECWAYEYNGDVRAEILIESGDFLKAAEE